MQRRTFSREFKLEAVNLVKERGVKVVQAARDP
jgi:transposase